MATPAPAPSLPCLVLDYDGRQCATLFSVSDGAHRACDAEELRGKRCWATSHGWVLAWDPATSATFLWNPRAPGGDRVVLPPLAKAPPVDSICALSGRPTEAAGCTVVLVEPPESTVLWYCHSGVPAAAWTRHEYDLGGTSVRVLEGDCWCKRFVSRLAPCGGRFYYLHSPTECGVIDFLPSGPPAFSTVPMKKVPLRVPEGDFMAVASVYPLDIDGELYTAYVFYHGADLNTVAGVGIYRMDFDRHEPVRVDNIGDRAILAGSRSRFGGWCPATEFGLLPNSVYWMSPVDKRLHVFDIGAGTEKVQELCKGVAEPSRQPFWMIPVHP